MKMLKFTDVFRDGDVFINFNSIIAVGAVSVYDPQGGCMIYVQGGTWFHVKESQSNVMETLLEFGVYCRNVKEEK